jgi:hypothetical protein
MIKSLCLFAVLATTATVASADSFTYLITVTTPNFGSPGWIDFSFNQANALTSLSATATITNFHQTGYLLDATTQTSTGVTGSLGTSVIIPNDQGGANFLTQGVSTWGSSFAFDVTISGTAVGTAAPDGSAFRVTLFNGGFLPFVSPLPDGEVANITINPSGDLSATGSTFAGGGATPSTPSQVPEPAAVWLLAPIAGVLLAMRRRRSAPDYN